MAFKRGGSKNSVAMPSAVGPSLPVTSAEKDAARPQPLVPAIPPIAVDGAVKQSVLHPPATRHPLGLPAGSVRALLCLIIVAFLVIQTARGVRVDVVWGEALMIALAHYFTTRRFVPISHELRSKLEGEGEIEPDENPLYLPKHSVRVLIIGAFIGLGLYLHSHGRLLESQSLSLLVSVGAYLLGIVVRSFLAWCSRRTGMTSPAWWIDLKAIGTLVIVLAAVGLQIAGAKELLHLEASRLEDFSLGLVLYYFGSR